MGTSFVLHTERGHHGVLHGERGHHGVLHGERGRHGVLDGERGHHLYYVVKGDIMVTGDIICVTR